MIFFFFNDYFLLATVLLASVATNHKTAAESDMLNKIAGVLKYAPDKIDAGVVERIGAGVVKEFVDKIGAGVVETW